ncbi:MAG: hypothetical protein A4S12_01975 [Proteobacteria bacterium SG_bin5]|nr:hypothetical protein [Sphingomonas sp.]OQW39648.1 MAG: hypothetical protein A4S12_01975 [Proteobacteria bacterium SG_bin5]
MNDPKKDQDKLAPEEALDGLAVAPPDPAQEKPTAPRDKDRRLDEALDESMDASDPPSITQPRAAPPGPDEDPSAKNRST